MAAPVAGENENSETRQRIRNDSGRENGVIYTVTPRRPLPQIYNLPYPSDRSPTRTKKNETVVSYTVLRERYQDENSTKSIILLGLIFIGALLSLGLVYINFPKLEEDEKQYITVPKHIDDAKNLGKVLYKYKDKHYFQVLGGYFITYIFLQSFAIPGSIFLSILSGFLFPFPLALTMVCLCSSIGASFCYLLSHLVGRRLVWKYIPERATSWSNTVKKHHSNLLNYIIFLRITPFLPNWFINIASPVINVPILPFFLGTFIGVAAPSFVAISAGTTLHELTSSSDAISWSSIAMLALLSIVSLLPVLFKHRLREKFE